MSDQTPSPQAMAAAYEIAKHIALVGTDSLIPITRIIDAQFSALREAADGLVDALSICVGQNMAARGKRAAALTAYANAKKT